MISCAIWGKYFKDLKLHKKNSLVLINTTLHMKSCYYLHKLHSTHLNDHLCVIKATTCTC